jgi:hypothetical protein
MDGWIDGGSARAGGTAVRRVRSAPGVERERLERSADEELLLRLRVDGEVPVLGQLAATEAVPVDVRRGAHAVTRRAVAARVR